MKVNQWLSAVCVAGVLTASSAWAQQVQQPTQPQVDQRQTSPEARQDARTDARTDADDQLRPKDRLAKAGLFKTNDLLGLNVQGQGGEDLGQIEDLVFDVKTGEIKYAAVSMGGFLGIGQQLVAVDWDSLQLMRRGEGDDADYFVSIPADKQRLETAHGFEDDHWPTTDERIFNVGTERDPALDRDVDTQRDQLDRPAQPQADERRTGVNINIDTQRDRTDRQAQTQHQDPALRDTGRQADQQHAGRQLDSEHQLSKAGLFKASDLIGLNVQGRGNEEMGQIEDLVIDVKAGEIKYAAVSMGGFLGIGDDLVAVDWNSLQLMRRGEGNDAEYFVSLPVDKQRMETAHGFDENRWPTSDEHIFDVGTERHTDADMDTERRTDVDVDIDVQRDRTDRPAQPETQPQVQPETQPQVQN